MRITIIGGGVMGAAIAEALINQAVVQPQNLKITDPDLLKLAYFKAQGCQILEDNLQAVEDADVIILAVKPQILQMVLAPLKNKFSTETLVISIAAGVTLKTIQETLAHQAVVRVMPNTPVLVAEGMSGWFATKEVSTEQKVTVKTILNACGKEVEVGSEDQIDLITALSGSGPAYVFLFLQGLMEGAIKLGLDEKSAKKAAMQTVLGSVLLAQNSEKDLQTLIENVTSKGGTTEQARLKFTELNFKEVIAQAMKAAYQRAKELGKKS